MEQNVNQRVIQLKKDIGLTDIEFCGKASISTGTLFRIKNNEAISQKVLNSIISAFNVNKEWLLNGKGKMLNENKEKEYAEASTPNNPWKDEAYAVLKNENSRMSKELDRLWQMVQHLSGGAKPNFHNAIEPARLTQLFPDKSFDSVRAVA